MSPSINVGNRQLAFFNPFYAPLGVSLPRSHHHCIHRSLDNFKYKKVASISTTACGSLVCNLEYREGVYDSVMASTEPEHLSDWQGRGGKKF